MYEKNMTTSSQIQKQVRGTLYSITSCLESFSSASSGARMASIGGISSSFWAACTLRSVASAANWAAIAAFFSSFVFLSSKFWKMSVYQRAINRGGTTTKGIHRIYILWLQGETLSTWVFHPLSLVQQWAVITVQTYIGHINRRRSIVNKIQRSISFFPLFSHLFNISKKHCPITIMKTRAR